MFENCSVYSVDLLSFFLPSFVTWKSILGNYAFVLNLLGKQVGEASKAVRIPHFSTPVPLRLADILCIYE
jgi:hypothetical protein